MDDGAGLVVEGFPRSGNTYTVVGIMLANPDLSISSHHHGAGELRRGRKAGVPTLALMRNPLAACASFHVYKRGRTSAASIVEDWLAFYTSRDLIPDHLADFGDVIADLGGVVAKLNGATLTRGAPIEVPTASALTIMVEVERRRGMRAGWDVRRRPIPTPERWPALERSRQLVTQAPRFLEAMEVYAKLAAYWSGPRA